MNNIVINKDSDFKNETISSVPIGINNIIIDTNENNFDLKKDEINNIKPMLSSNSNRITIPDGKKVKIRPLLNKKVPFNTFSAMANPKKNMSGNMSSDENTESSDSYEAESDEILSNNSKNNYRVENKYTNDDDDDDDIDNQNYNEMDDADDDENDYSSLDNSVIKNKNSYKSKGDDDEEEDDDDEEDDDNESAVSVKQKTYEEIQQEKQKILFNLERLQKQGYPPSKKYSMASSFEDMQFEHDRLKKQRDVEKSIKFSRKILMAFVSGIEFLNGRFDPFDVKLEGCDTQVIRVPSRHRHNY
jgi:hypothetical protein